MYRFDIYFIKQVLGNDIPVYDVIRYLCKYRGPHNNEWHFTVVDMIED
jgi:hypothetical protein